MVTGWTVDWKVPGSTPSRGTIR